MGYNVKAINKTCMDCGKAKVTQKRLKREADDRAIERGIRLMINITSIKERSIVGNKFWLIMLDEGRNMIWSEFLKKKSNNSEKVYKHLMKMKG